MPAVIVVMPDWVTPTLIGIVAGAVFYWLGRRTRTQSRMAFQRFDFMVVGHQSQATESLESIKILFKESVVPRVVVTRLAVWNTGNTAVDGAQLATVAPLAFHAETGAAILDAQIVKTTNDANKCRMRIAEDSSHAFIEFDYLNERDGALFQITHTSAKDAAKLTGSIKGISKGVEDWGELDRWEDQKSRLKPMRYILGFGLILLCLTWLEERLAPKYPLLKTISNWLGVGFAVIAFLFILAVISTFVYLIIQTRSRTIPKSLSRG